MGVKSAIRIIKARKPKILKFRLIYMKTCLQSFIEKILDFHIQKIITLKRRISEKRQIKKLFQSRSPSLTFSEGLFQKVFMAELPIKTRSQKK